MVTTLTSDWPLADPTSGSSTPQVRTRHEEKEPRFLRYSHEGHVARACDTPTSHINPEPWQILHGWTYSLPFASKLDEWHLSRNEERHGQLAMLPTPSEVEAVISQLSKKHLREFAAAIMATAVESARWGRVNLETIRLLNGWFATMEEIVAAGDQLEEILSRRMRPGITNI